MTSRERVLQTLNHREPDLIPLDLGSSGVTGMQVSSVYKLRQALTLDPPGTPVKVVEPYQMLGEIAPDLMEALGVDVVGFGPPENLFGFRNERWKEWRLFDGTPVLVPGEFNTEPESNGDILMYPGGDKSAAPSGRMPHGGYYFDTIVRQDPIDDAVLNIHDNLEEFPPVTDAALRHFEAEATRLRSTGLAVLGNFGGTAFGDIALVPGMWLKHPKGIRDMTEWYTSTLTRRDHIYEIFYRQCEIALGNLKRIAAILGDLVDVVFMSGADFGAQHGPFISPDVLRDLYKPFQSRLNHWIHENTSWKTFIHSCGSVRVFYDDFLEAEYDILNPVQCSAAHMDPRELKAGFGSRAVFWGGAVDTQHTLPFGTPDEVRAEVRERIAIFRPGGGFVFNPIHNVQAGVPTENLLALYETFSECRAY
ncbi:MAG: methyltransferase [Candidatus Hydrogenedentota bacterium]